MIPFYYFGWGFLLTVWSWGKSAQPAGSEDAGWLQPDTEATWSERGEVYKKRGSQEFGLSSTFLVLSRFSLFPLLSPCFSCPSSLILHFSLTRQTSTKALSLRPSIRLFSLPSPPLLFFFFSSSQTDTATLLDVSFSLACPNKGAQSCET